MPESPTALAFRAMDDVTRYVFHNYTHLMSIHERGAWRNCTVSMKGESYGDPVYAWSLLENFGAKDAEVAELLSHGPEHFFVATRDRLLKEHKDEIFLNYCPRCDALAITPQAKICPKCAFNWRRASQNPI
jgi:hypothetical protein